MNQRTSIVAIGVFVLIIIGMFVFTMMKKQEMQQPQATVATTTQTQSPSPYDSITRVTAKDFYANGVHTLVGSITMPTPCDLLNTAATSASTTPTQIAVAFSIINNSSMCAQVQTAQQFSVTATGTKDAVYSATLMGRPIILNIVPPAPGETPTHFQLFQKG